MKPEWCPQWAWGEAIRVAEKTVDHGWMEDCPAVYHIARALLDAHQRGRREGMEGAALIAIGEGDGTDPYVADHIADAIRAKAQEVKL